MIHGITRDPWANLDELLGEHEAREEDMEQQNHDPEEMIVRADSDSLAAAQMAELQPLSLDSVLERMKLIKQIQETCMQPDRHYGVIPGTQKPTLYKAGAEILAVAFRLRTRYDINMREYAGGHREYCVEAFLDYIPSQTLIAQGTGVCTTLETKYRYRSESTGREVPREYWDHRNCELLGGQAYFPRKKDGKWLIYQQVQTANPADYWNTARKMATKRAFVAAILAGTAASEVFSQDLEDFDAHVFDVAGESTTTKTEPEPDRKVLQARVFAIVADMGVPSKDRKEAVHAHLRTFSGGDCERLRDCSTPNLERFVEYLEKQRK